MQILTGCVIEEPLRLGMTVPTAEGPLNSSRDAMSTHSMHSICVILLNLAPEEEQKGSLPVTMSKADLVLSATMVALYCCCDTVSFRPASDSAPPLTNAYSSPNPVTASLKLNTTLEP